MTKTHTVSFVQTHDVIWLPGGPGTMGNTLPCSSKSIPQALFKVPGGVLFECGQITAFIPDTHCKVIVLSGEINGVPAPKAATVTQIGPKGK